MDYPTVMRGFYPFYERSSRLLSKEMRKNGLNISPAVVSNYANAQREPNSKMLLGISSFFNISCDFFINSKTFYIRNLRFIKNIEKACALGNSKYRLIASLISTLSYELNGKSNIDVNIYKMEPLNITNNIRLLREITGVKSKRLALDFGYKYPSIISLFEHRVKDIEFAVLEKYSKYFSISAHQIVSGEPLTVNIKNSSLRDNTLKIDRNYSIPQIIHLNAVIEEILK